MSEREDFQKGIEQLIDRMIARLSEEMQSTVRKQLAQQREIAWIARAEVLKAQEEQKRLEEAAKRAADAAERELLNLLVTAVFQQKEQLREIDPNDVGKHIELLLKILEGAPKRAAVDEKELLNLLVVSMSQQKEQLGGNSQDVQKHVELLLKVNEKYTELEVAKARCPKTVPLEADSDYLAGLLNARYLDKVLIAEIVRAEGRHVPLTMLMIDIDDLRRVNDKLGHLAGEEVLKSVADLLRSFVRPKDFVFRSGGDEFIVLLPGIGRDLGLQIAQSIRDRIGTSTLALVGKITVTIAACEHETGEAPDSFLARTDQAMYRAKRGGDDDMISVWVPVR